jgi:hypothetical protein
MRESSSWGYNWATQFLWDIYIYEDLALQVWEVSNLRQLNMVMESHGTRNREWMRWRGPPAIVKARFVLSSKRATRIKKRNCLTVIKIWAWAPNRGLTRRQTGRLTVGCNITLILAWVAVELVESCSREKWEAGSWGRGEFWNPEESQCLLLEAATKQRLVKIEKALYEM